MRRDDDWKRPLEAVLRVGGVMAHRIVGPWIDVALESVLDVFSGEQSAVGSRENYVGRVGPHGDVSALTATNVVPITDVDTATLPARPAERRIVLLRAAYAIRKMIGRDHVIEL